MLAQRTWEVSHLPLKFCSFQDFPGNILLNIGNQLSVEPMSGQTSDPASMPIKLTFPNILLFLSIHVPLLMTACFPKDRLAFQKD
ncbi:hypothetical protein DPSP01_004605 [Paraphaeosphaeria sporulosa]|uniref:Uncharacterized protein n=1 Tax=Paraphaeosphaeria sporulosa TaxID=1460663 RepID=A0A177CQD7_9PLEO|nr:uncharacterized protein CC84DRAFT_452646 [Paraphaeosphaeria sporulosa]OAG09734.1 hypothetical protein CC84DRAFT_452646 [Paraphaeosphaeria sporulosa]